ncbi:MAG: phosphate/phosphite/phosphonate ABC transporter substrate-binding protein [Gammaproteobacteria bacterium]|nr:phosphate/phosphite/phosphonate ABC transporter substrate-binding protein [Gammaproteobacteria bacterium]
MATIVSCGGNNEQDYNPQFSADPPMEVQQYLFGVHPLHNPNRLHLVFGPLIDYLNTALPNLNFKLEASRDYAAFDRKLYAGHFDFSLPNPYQTVNSLRHGYRVFGKMGDDHNFRGIILVRKETEPISIEDLKGEAVSFPAPTALAGTMLPQYYLQIHGVDVMNELELRYVGSQESSIMNVYLGNVIAAATWPPPWQALSKQRPELVRELIVKWETETLPNNGLVVRMDIPDSIVRQVAAALFSLHNDKAGQVLLSRMELSRFEPATNSTYDPVREFITKFSANVRNIE